MPDSLVALRTALADAWLGDTHEARQVFGTGEAAKVFDKRLLDLLVGLGLAPTIDATSIYGADIAGVMREIHETSQAERLAFIQQLKLNIAAYSSPVTASFSWSPFVKFFANTSFAGTEVAAIPGSGYFTLSRINPFRIAFDARLEIAITSIPSPLIYAITMDDAIGDIITNPEFGTSDDALDLRAAFQSGLNLNLSGSMSLCSGSAFIDESIKSHPGCGYTPFSFVGIGPGFVSGSTKISMENAKAAGPYLNADGPQSPHAYLPTAFQFSGIVNV